MMLAGEQFSIGVPKELAEYLYEHGFDQPVEDSRDALQTLETVRAYVEVAAGLVSSLDEFASVLLNVGELRELCQAFAGFFKRRGASASNAAKPGALDEDGLHFSVTLSKPSAESLSGRIEFDNITSTSEHEFVDGALQALRKLVADAG
jgi:hypothetical protein